MLRCETVAFSSLLVWAGLFSGGERAAAAATSLPLKCDYDNGTDQTGCSVEAKTLQGAQDFSTEFEVRYSFNCTGNAVDIGLQTDVEYKPFVRSALPQRMTLLGTAYLRVFVPAPEALYAASLSKSCQIEIEAVNPFPSDDTLRLWQQQATDEAKILTLSLRQLTLAKNLALVVDWDDEQLAATAARLQEQLAEILPPSLPYEALVYPLTCGDPAKCGKLKDAADMPSGWDLTAALHPEIPDLVALRAQVESIRAGRPPVYSPQDVAAYKQALEGELQAADRLIQRAEQWSQRLSEQAQAAVERLKALREQVTAEG